MKFEYDIFICHTKIDDESLRPDKAGWVSEFQRLLTIRLSQITGREPRIARSHHQAGNASAAAAIQDQINKAACFISIFTPGHLRDAACMDQLNQFIDQSNASIGLRINNKSRFFKLIKTPVPRENHPASTQDILGYEFFMISPDTQRAMEFEPSQDVDPVLSKNYWTRLNDIAHDLADLLEELEDLPEPSAKKASDPVTSIPKSSEQLTVFLAESTYDMMPFREDIRRELQEHGYRVLPDQQLPLYASAYEEKVQEMLQESILAVHLLGGSYGIVPEGTQSSTIVLQNELAAKYAQDSGLNRLIWIPPDIVSEDERQTSFLDIVRNDSLAQFGADLFETPIEELKYSIHDKINAHKRKLEEANKPKEQPKQNGLSTPPLVYLICDQRDIDQTIPLEDYLFDQGFEVILPVFDGDPQQVRLDHQENLKSCDATLIYYGAANELWLRSKTRDLLKIAGYGRVKPLHTKAVVLAPPDDPQKERFRAQNTLVVKMMEGFSPGLFQEFSQHLSQHHTAGS